MRLFTCTLKYFKVCRSSGKNRKCLNTVQVFLLISRVFYDLYLSVLKHEYQVLHPTSDLQHSYCYNSFWVVVYTNKKARFIATENTQQNLVSVYFFPKTDLYETNIDKCKLGINVNIITVNWYSILACMCVYVCVYS